MICEKFLRSMQMPDDVAEAQAWSRALVHCEYRGPGDLTAAIGRVAGHLQVSYGALYSLRYRPPKSVPTRVYKRLEAAYQAMCEKQERLRSRERKITLGETPIAAALVRAADALAGAKE